MTIQRRLSFNIKSGNLDYQSRPTSFDVSDPVRVFGPAPGMIAVGTGGVPIDLSMFVEPGRYWIQNLSTTNWVEYGIYHVATGQFFPWGEIPPGEAFEGLLSRNFRETYDQTGTGTSAASDKLMLKANGAECFVRLDIFDR